MTSATHISQYTPTDEVPALGEAELHPAFDGRAFDGKAVDGRAFGGRALRDQLADLVRPDTALWNARELRDLTSNVSSELTGPLLDIAEVREQRRWWGAAGAHRRRRAVAAHVGAGPGHRTARPRGRVRLVHRPVRTVAGELDRKSVV